MPHHYASASGKRKHALWLVCCAIITSSTPNKTRMSSKQEQQTDSTEHSRAHLLWDVLVFQFKLAADGLRDLLLSPLSILSAIAGLVAGGEDPHQYFRRLIALGRRSEAWINLFDHPNRDRTSDALIDPLKRRVMTKAERNPFMSKAGAQLNKALDGVNDRMRPRSQSAREKLDG